MEYINRTGEVELPKLNDNKYKEEIDTSQIACSYFHQLNLMLISKLERKYLDDFTIANYDPEPYYNCAKDFDAEAVARYRKAIIV